MLDQFFQPGGGRSAFDYFVQGQEAKQNYEINQQRKQANQQAIEQAELMNPLLLQAKQAGIDLTNAQKVGMIGQEDREQQMLPGQLQAQTDQSDFVAQQIAASKTGELGTLQSIEESKTSQQFNEFNLQQARAEAKRERSARAQQAEQAAILEADKALSVYEQMAKTDPEGAERFKAQKFEEYGIDDESFDPSVIKAQANVLKMQQGDEFEQVKGSPGMVFNKTNGTFSVDQATMEKALELSQKDGILKGKDLAGVNDKVTALVKPVEEVVAAADDLGSLAENANPTSKLAMIFKFMKALDPTSVVREGEQDMLVKSGGPWDTFQAAIDSLQGGGKLSSNLMSDIVETADIMAANKIETTEKALGGYLGVLEDNLSAKSMNRLMARIPKLEDKGRAQTATQTRQQPSPSQTQTNQAAEIPGGQKRIKLTAEDMEGL